jgi:hypothetical protein
MNLSSLQPKQIGVGIAVVAFVYLFIVPWTWPLPEVEAEVPETAALGQDIQIPITISAWHSNVDIYNVRFYTDHYGSTAHGEEGLFYPTPVLDREARRFVGVWGYNHLTYPWSETIYVTVPLSQFAQEKLLGPGILRGKVDVNFNYRPGHVGRRMAGHDYTRQTMLSVPFTITITEQ